LDYDNGDRRNPELVASLIQASYKTLESLTLRSVIGNLSPLSPLAKSQKLKSLELDYIPLEKVDIELLESLPKLQSLSKVDLVDQSDSSWLDGVFDSCGKTL